MLELYEEAIAEGQLSHVVVVGWGNHPGVERELPFMLPKTERARNITLHARLVFMRFTGAMAVPTRGPSDRPAPTP